MIYKDNSVAYPILEGKALVKVFLREKKPCHSWFSAMSRKVRHYFLCREMESFFPGTPPVDEYSLVKLETPGNGYVKAARVDNWELNLASDSLSLLQRFKMAFTAVMAAGIISLGALNSGAINYLPEVGSNFHAARENTPESKSNDSPVIKVSSEIEEFICSSVNSFPGSLGTARRHAFRSAGHVNVVHTDSPGAHTDQGGETPHMNLQEPHGDHTNHRNITHNNHMNRAHINSSTTAHTVVAHADTVGDVHLNFHANGTVGHANSPGSHTNLLY
jgi:hypothetical protein